jgi:hypothetical protein
LDKKTLNLDDIKLDSAYVLDVEESRRFNEQIIKYYDKFKKEDSILYSKETLLNLRNNIENCNKVWFIDYYKNLNIKKIHRIHLCKNKFCMNCKRVAQASRMAKYSDELEPHSSYLYHLTLTNPNCDGNNLRMTIKHMAKCFKSLIRYIDGNKKIVGLDFSNWGYLGAIRSLEVTFKGNSYHPHFHCCLALEHLDFREENKTIINTYSYSRRSGIKELKTTFCNEEILIQKIWYLLINKQKVTLKSISEVKLGYSCKMDKFVEDDYQELFKYLTKGTGENGQVMKYNNFVALNYGTYRLKQIQGYGIFFNITDDGDTESLVEDYNRYVDWLNENDNPERLFEFASQFDKDKTIKNMHRKMFDKEQINNFNNKFGVVDTDQSIYISLKKFIHYMK